MLHHIYLGRFHGEQTVLQNAFLQLKKYKNLYIVDFICHGVPLPKVFKEYLLQMERKKGGKVVSFRFRNKDHGWSQTGLQLGTEVRFEDGTTKRNYPAFKDAFMNGFLDNLFLRPSCYLCQV